MEKIKFLVIHNRDPKRKEVLVNELINNGVIIEDIEFIEYPNKDELTFKIKNLLYKNQVDTTSRFQILLINKRWLDMFLINISSH